MARYSALPKHIRAGLDGIEPSRGGELVYHPIHAVLKSGGFLDTGYSVPGKSYLKYWGVYPEDDRAKRWTHIDDVAAV